MSYAQPQFDVFLAHNSQDKPFVRAIANELNRRGLKPWLDEQEILGGDVIVDIVHDGISQSKAGAFFIGPNGLGNFQENIELYSVIQWFLTQKQNSQSFRVIPILLPSVSSIPTKLWYFQQWRWIQFTQPDDEVALDDLVRSVRGREPQAAIEPKKEVPITQKRRNLEVIETQNTPQNRRDDSGDDYTRLRDLLKAGQWKEADQETLAVMLKAAGREEEGWLSSQSIENFPCTDLRTIDQLWVKYSEGRFGFSVQKRIWESVGKDYEKFGDRVGWRKGMFWNKEWLTYNELTFSTNAPRDISRLISQEVPRISLNLLTFYYSFSARKTNLHATSSISWFVAFH